MSKNVTHTEDTYLVMLLTLGGGSRAPATLSPRLDWLICAASMCFSLDLLYRCRCKRQKRPARGMADSRPSVVPMTSKVVPEPTDDLPPPQVTLSVGYSKFRSEMQHTARYSIEDTYLVMLLTPSQMCAKISARIFDEQVRNCCEWSGAKECTSRRPRRML